MKKRFRFIILFVVAFFCQQLYGQYIFKLSGIIDPGIKGIKIRLSTNLMDSAYAISRDSVIINKLAFPKNGKFTFLVPSKNRFEFVKLTVTQNGKYLKSWEFFVSDVPATIHILSLKREVVPDIQLKNSPFVKEMNDYDLVIKKPREELSEANLKARQSVRNLTEKDLLVTTKRLASSRLLLSRIKYIVSNPDSYYSLYVFDKDILRSIQGVNLPADSLMSIFNKLGRELKNSRLGNHVYTNIKQRESLSIGHSLPEFSFLTNDAQRYTLSDKKGKKYSLFCFWASYCGPCIRSIPVLKRIDSMYNLKGLQIVSISIDTSVMIWKACLLKYRMPWLQTVDLPQYIGNSQNLQDIFNLNYIPQYFLIDENRTILYQNVQASDNDEFQVLFDMLDRLLSTR